MAHNIPPLGPQPDFNLISDSIRTGALTLATQFERCANIPAIVQSEQIVGLLQRMDQRLERIERHLAVLETKIDHQ